MNNGPSVQWHSCCLKSSKSNNDHVMGWPETRLHTSPTCAATACGVQEHLGAATNEKQDAGSMREGGGLRRSASAVTRDKENSKEQDGDEEGRDSRITDREGDEEVTAGQRNAEIGVWLLPNRGEEEK
ncbi:hypothetical protein NDU88_000780 [Pleurodeles waltl]|uniref:Uncharacterized protein n=1 Tax=Pleurodeles waltl TaxID=8319 RepID=A0AAV7KYS8_PLEWA|nr:hypothetical protein NDU88_000780 [Pleurodeles waltl]